MTTLNSKAIQAKLHSIFRANAKMKAISKMLTQSFSVEKTSDKNKFSIVLKNGETEQAELFANRFLVIGYAKPKGAKNDTIFLNKTVSMTSVNARKVIVVDMDARTIENGDEFKGFAMDDKSTAVLSFIMHHDMSLITVRNYINHTQLYVARFNGQELVCDNIKEMRTFIKQNISDICNHSDADFVHAIEAQSAMEVASLSVAIDGLALNF